MWAAHDAYRRLTPPRRTVRAVLLSPQRVVVIDWVEGPAAEYKLSFPLAPGAVWGAGSVQLPGGVVAFITLPGEVTVHHGERDPYDGWWSRTYGQAEPATRLEVCGQTRNPVVWSIGVADDGIPTTVQNNRVRIGEDQLEVEWSEGRVVLRHLAGNGVEQVAILRLD